MIVGKKELTIIYETGIVKKTLEKFTKQFSFTLGTKTFKYNKLSCIYLFIYVSIYQYIHSFVHLCIYSSLPALVYCTITLYL